MGSVAASCHFALHACNRSFFARDYQSILVLTSLTNTRTGQSGRLSSHHAYATEGEFYSHSRGARLNTNASSLYRSEGCIFPNTFSRLIYPSLAIVEF